jgi:hypothetical protein
MYEILNTGREEQKKLLKTSRLKKKIIYQAKFFFMWDVDVSLTETYWYYLNRLLHLDVKRWAYWIVYSLETFQISVNNSMETHLSKIYMFLLGRWAKV